MMGIAKEEMIAENVKKKKSPMPATPYCLELACDKK